MWLPKRMIEGDAGGSGEGSGTCTVACNSPGSPGWERERHLLANILPGEDDATGLAFETADMPLLVQCQEGLAMFNLLFAPSTVWKNKSE